MVECRITRYECRRAGATEPGCAADRRPSAGMSRRARLHSSRSGTSQLSGVARGRPSFYLFDVVPSRPTLPAFRQSARRYAQITSPQPENVIRRPRSENTASPEQQQSLPSASGSGLA